MEESKQKAIVDNILVSNAAEEIARPQLLNEIISRSTHVILLMMGHCDYSTM